MSQTDPARIADEMLTVFMSFGGGDRGGSGTGILHGGKVVKIPPRQDLQAIPAEQRDEMILQAVQVLTQGLSHDGMRAALEHGTSEAEGLAAR